MFQRQLFQIIGILGRYPGRQQSSQNEQHQDYTSHHGRGIVQKAVKQSGFDALLIHNGSSD
jgi:hypothetical protein